MDKPKRGTAVKNTNVTTRILLILAIVVLSILAGHKKVTINQQFLAASQDAVYCPQDNLEAQEAYKTGVTTLWVTIATETGSTSYAVRMLEAYETWQIDIPDGHTAVYSVTQAEGWVISDITLDGPSILGFSSSIHNHDGSQMDFSVIIDELGTVPNSPQSQTVTVSRITGWHPMTYEVTITCHQ